ncbi:MAG TPA: aminotransferase class III-fold pyridoxal phosphate-dependent enzyme [Phycisphaerales bacterium]|nr:aminotransferase class III-fold pyridoxal phosphate-dependent enzyme [Phycisphaerales bacterium]
MTPAAAHASPSKADPIAPAAGGAASALAGAGLTDAPVVRRAIDALVQEVGTRSARLSDARPPRGELGESYDALLKRAADTRGRALLYPYLGTGVGNGALVELADGSVKWDMVCGIGVHFFGHSEPGLVRAALEAGLSDILQHGNLQANFEAYAFAEKLLAHAGRQSRLKHAYLTTSGVMANENALKVCYQKTGGAAPRVLAFQDCFMGRTVTMSQIGDSAANRIGLPLNTLVDYVPFYDAVLAEADGPQAAIDRSVMALRQHLDRYPKQHACFVFELVQGEGGFNTAPREFFTALMGLCRERGVIIWDDEIQTFGRLESMFAFELLGLGDWVDIVTIGKMTQACATLYTEDLNPGPGLLSGTFTSTSAAYRVGLHVLDRLASGAYYGPKGLIARNFAAFARQVRALASKHPEWFPPVDPPGAPDIVGGAGGMMRFTPFAGRKDRIMKACKHLFDEGVITFYAGHGPYHVRMLPPLGVFREEDWPKVFACVERGLARAAAEIGPTDRAPGQN